MESAFHGRCGGSRLRHAQRAGFDCRQRARPSGFRDRGLSSAPQTRRSGFRHSIPRRPHARAGRSRAAGSEVGRNNRRSSAVDRARHYRLQRDSRRRRTGPARRLLLVVRSPRQTGGGGNHGTRKAGEARSDPVVRRRVFLRVGIRQAPALAAAQSRKAGTIRERVRALRHGRGHSVRNHRSRSK